MAQFPARFNDGVTALDRQVTVTVAADGLEILGPDARAFWRKQDIEVVDKAGRVWRLSSKDAPDARLVIEKSKEIEAALRAGGIIDPQRDALKAWQLVGGLTAVAAALVFVIFFAIPMAAEPLARATPRDVEEQLGVNLARQVNTFMRPCENTSSADSAIMPLLNDLEAASEPGFPITLRFVQERSPNALALAGGQVMVTSGLLRELENPDELAAVIAHEIGHVKARDSMVALYRNAGLGILLEVITGGSGVAQQAILLGGQLTELSYTRGQERRADVAAIDMLDKAGLDPAALARAFTRLKGYVEEEEADAKKAGLPADINIPEWMQSHPDLDRRIVEARKAAKPASREALSAADWAIVRAACKKT